MATSRQKKPSNVGRSGKPSSASDQPVRKQSETRQRRGKKVSKSPSLQAQPLLVDFHPKIVVGKSLPLEFDRQNVQGLPLNEWLRLYAEAEKVYPFPHPDEVEFDEEGFAKHHVIVAPGANHILVPPSQDPSSRLGVFSTAGGGTPVQGVQGGKHKPLPSPALIKQVVLGYLSNLPPVDDKAVADQMKKRLVYGEFNGEFWNQQKSTYCLDALSEIVVRHHLIYCIECDLPGLQVVGKAVGYGYFCSQVNTRGQGVGFLVHPRLRVVGKPQTFWAIAKVGGVQDLRPGFLIETEDSVTGTRRKHMVLHPKSMRGGPAQTAPIRYQQFHEAAKVVQPMQDVIIAGDMNCFLNNTHDTDPLTQVGAKLVFPGDTTSTQIMGGRLDGYFTYNLSRKVGRYQVRNFWRDKRIGRALSDHGLLTVVEYLNGDSSDSGADNQGTEVATP